MPGETSAQNGKLGGRPALVATKLRQELIRLAEENAKPLAKALYDKALKGDVPALKEYMDRIMGRPAQAIDVTTNGKDLPTPILAALKPDAPAVNETADEAADEKSE